MARTGRPKGPFIISDEECEELVRLSKRVTFGQDLDETARAACLGATFLIDFCYFEDKGTRSHRRRREGLLGGVR